MVTHNQREGWSLRVRLVSQRPLVVSGCLQSMSWQCGWGGYSVAARIDCESVLTIGRQLVWRRSGFPPFNHWSRVATHNQRAVRVEACVGRSALELVVSGRSQLTGQ